jgi:hypothetical protein
VKRLPFHYRASLFRQSVRPRRMIRPVTATAVVVPALTAFVDMLLFAAAVVSSAFELRYMFTCSA